MPNTFFEKSKKISNDYIQSIVFLDDKAYKAKDNADTNHDFDALRISQVFAEENKICAVYKPESQSNIQKFKIIADKADVVILDWQIIFTEAVEPGMEDEDAPDDPRGVYTKDVIKSVLFEEGKVKNSLKLFVVYTGDYTLLESITEEIFKEVLNSSEEYTLDINNCSIESSKVKILIRAKEVRLRDADTAKYGNKIVKYEDMPDFILNEFTSLTSGLLSDFALISLSTLRKNSSKILGIFSKKMDAAFLSHKALIPKQEDAEDLLIELFGDSIKDLLFYSNVNDVLRSELIETWIDNTIQEEDFPIGKKNLKRTPALVKGLINSRTEKIEERLKELLTEEFSKTEREIILNKLTEFYTTPENRNDVETIDKHFSQLTHHKSLFLPKRSEPKLTLGTLLKSNKNDTHYICIQQKCDTVRIPKGGERKFLFIPLDVSENKFDILTSSGVRLKRNKSSFAIRTIKFVCIDDSGVIKAEKNEDGIFTFQQKYNGENDEKFFWVLDLKDLHSQRIITEYTSSLSRVGLDESEWHRRNLG